MTFDERLAELMEEAQVPKRLSPESIKRMLDEQMSMGAKGSSGAGNINKDSKHRPPVHVHGNKRNRTGVLAGRTAAALAACVAFAFGVMALEQVTQKPGGYIQSDGQGEIIAATDYADVYKAIQNVFINNGSVVAGSGQVTSPPPQTAGTGQMIGGDESDTVSETTAATVPETTVDSGAGTETSGGTSSSTPSPAPVKQVKGSYLSSTLPQSGVENPRDTITVEGQGLTLYLSNGAVYAVSHKEGNPQITARIPSAEGTPREIFLAGNRLVIVSDNQLWLPYTASVTAFSESQSAAETTVSSETDMAASVGTAENGTPHTALSEKAGVNPVVSDSKTEDSSISEPAEGDIVGLESAVSETTPQTVSAGASGAVLQNNVVVEIYDLASITSGEPIKLGSYKQNGAYLSAHQSEDGKIFLVTDYAQYHTKPLERQEDLDNYVPSYYMNGDKYYIQAQDICLPADSSSRGTASYTIVSSINPADEFQPMTSVKAVLGESKSVSAAKGSIYVAGPSYSSKGETNTSILKFTVGGGISYAAQVSVEGTLAADESLRFQDGQLRVVTTTAKGHHLYLIGEDLKPAGSSETLCPGQLVTDIRHTSSAVQLVTGQTMTQVTVSELLNGNSSKGAQLETSTVTSSSVFGFGNGLGVTVSAAEGQFTVSVCDINTFEVLDSKTLKGTVPAEAASGGGILLDSGRGLIGIPASDKGDFGARNLYYLFTYTPEKGFAEVGGGLLEYNDIGPGAAFQYAVAEGGADDGIIYMFSPTRVVAARLSDLKVISTVNL